MMGKTGIVYAGHAAQKMGSGCNIFVTRKKYIEKGRLSTSWLILFFHLNSKNT